MFRDSSTSCTKRQQSLSCSDTFSIFGPDYISKCDGKFDEETQNPMSPSNTNVTLTHVTTLASTPNSMTIRPAFGYNSPTSQTASLTVPHSVLFEYGMPVMMMMMMMMTIITIIIITKNNRANDVWQNWLAVEHLVSSTTSTLALELTTPVVSVR